VHFIPASAAGGCTMTISAPHEPQNFIPASFKAWQLLQTCLSFCLPSLFPVDLKFLITSFATSLPTPAPAPKPKPETTDFNIFSLLTLLFATLFYILFTFSILTLASAYFPKQKMPKTSTTKAV
jgi:hypothetical protein